jgi:hypothetical protein
LPALLALALAGVLLAGCGEDQGVAAGASVDAYFGAPLCAEAKHGLAQARGRAGDVRVRVVCLDDAGRGKRLDLAAVGVNARRATEDSTAIAYIEFPGAANRFSQPIVEEAGIAWERAGNGKFATERLLAAVEEAGSGSLREEVRKVLEGERG